MSTSRRSTKRPSTQARPHAQPGTQRQTTARSTTARQTAARPTTTQRPAPHGQTRGQAQARKPTDSGTSAPLPPITRAARARRRWWREPRTLGGIIAAALVVVGLVALLAHQQAASASGVTARGAAPTATAHAAASPAATAKATTKAGATTNPVAGSTGSPCGRTVAMDDDSFFFRSCTIKRGATLTFQNQSGTETHVLCSGFFQVCHPALDAPAELNDAAPVVLAPGARHSFAFTHAGVFNITCLAHGGMDITVTVTD